MILIKYFQIMEFQNTGKLMFLNAEITSRKIFQDRPYSSCIKIFHNYF